MVSFIRDLVRTERRAMAENREAWARSFEAAQQVQRIQAELDELQARPDWVPPAPRRLRDWS